MSDRFQPSSRGDLPDLVASQPLAWVVSGEGSDLHATPLPLQLVCDETGKPMFLKGHFGRSNPHWRALRDSPRATVLLLGPHGYVSPSWFADRARAPTWNYTSAVFDVDVELRDSKADAERLLGGLVKDMESGRPAAWQMDELGRRYEGLAAGVVGFHAHIRSVRSKFKLGQDEPDAVFDDILRGLWVEGRHSLVEWMLRLGKERGQHALEGLGPPAVPVDHEAGQFVEAVNAGSGLPAPGRKPDWPGRREAAERTRMPLRQGGPEMRRSENVVAETEAGPVGLRIHDPDPDTPKPILGYLHGGGWTMFSLDTHDRLMREFAARAGIVVVGIDYALAPEVRYPTALDQVAGVVRWLRKHGRSFGLAASRVALGGDSAGGNLAVAAALKLRDMGESGAVNAIMSYYGGFVPTCSSHARRLYGGPGNMLTADEMKTYWTTYVSHVRDLEDPYVNVLAASLEDLPACFLGVAECDILAEQNLQMAGKLMAARVPVEVNVYPGAPHSFLEAVSMSSLAGRAIDDGATWLRRVLCVDGV